MNRVPRKVLWIVLLTGAVSILGELLVSKNLDGIVAQHRMIMEEHVENREYMSEISRLLYAHQSVVANYLITQEPDLRTEYKKEMDSLYEELEKAILAFKEHINGEKREQLYHKVYSDYTSYHMNADMIVQFCNEGSENMALYYNDHILNDYVEKINANLDALDQDTLQAITDAQDEMGELIHYADLTQVGSIATVIILTVFCVVYCVRITTGLDHYKQELEEELEVKNRALQEHNEKMLALQDGIIIGMANLIENRDGDTGEHVKRTSFYVAILAKEAQRQKLYPDVLTDEYIERLVKAAPLHDVGKIVISDRILNKPGKLTPEEFEIMKTHTTEGGRIIREVFDKMEDQVYVDMAVEVVTYHHEKWDGSGYMKHLKGEEIPLSARIMAIADVFDALVSKRCYKEPMDWGDAFKLMEASSGKHFDPQLLKIFLSLKPQIEEFLKESMKSPVS